MVTESYNEMEKTHHTWKGRQIRANIDDALGGIESARTLKAILKFIQTKKGSQ